MNYKWALREFLCYFSKDELLEKYRELAKDQYDNRAEDGNTAYQENKEITLVLKEIELILEKCYGVTKEELSDAIWENISTHFDYDQE